MVSAMQNWAGNQRWTPQAVQYPADEGELISLVRNAVGDRGRLIVGAGLRPDRLDNRAGGHRKRRSVRSGGH